MLLVNARNLYLLQVVNDMFKSFMTEDKILEMVSKSQEFEQIKVRSLVSLMPYFV